MSVLVDVTRSQWLTGVSSVKLCSTRSIREWLEYDDYQMYDACLPTEINITISRSDQLAAAFASEAKRFATASIESIAGANAWPIVPKGCAWLLIRAYYSAYYAAHSMMRLCGRSISHLENSSLRRPYKIAELYGNQPEKPFSNGTYRFNVDSLNKKVNATFIPKGKTGSHGILWQAFTEFFRDLEAAINNSDAPRALAVQCIDRLGSVRDVLTSESCKDTGNWLSLMRNSVNYQLSHGLWYPTSISRKRAEEYYQVSNQWKLDPLKINLHQHSSDPILKVLGSSSFITSYCRDQCEDIIKRGPRNSIHSNGVPALMKLCKNK